MSPTVIEQRTFYDCFYQSLHACFIIYSFIVKQPIYSFGESTSASPQAVIIAICMGFITTSFQQYYSLTVLNFS